MNEAISNLTTAAESSPYPITFTLHEKIRVDDDEDFVFVKIRDRFPDTTFHSAYRLYVNTFNQVKDWEQTGLDTLVVHALNDVNWTIVTGKQIGRAHV